MSKFMRSLCKIAIPVTLQSILQASVFVLYAPVKVENMILGGGIIRSGGNTKIIMIIDVVGTWCIGIPLCLLAAYVFEWEIIGVYTLLTTEEIFRLAVSLAILKKRKWMISLS